MTDQTAATATIPAEQRIRIHLDSVCSQIGQPGHDLRNKLLASMTSTNRWERQRSPVLQAAVSYLNGVTLSDSLWREAVCELLNARPAYETSYDKIADYKLVLGDLLPEDIVQAAERENQQLEYENGTNTTAAQDWPVYMQRRANEPVSDCTFSTGIDSVDSDLAGGIGGLTFLLGDKGVGKTSLVINCITNALNDQQTAVLFYSLDMPKDAIYDRIACRELGVPHRDLSSFFQNETADSPEMLALENKLTRLRVVERDYTVKQPANDDAPLERGMSEFSIMTDVRQLVAEANATRILIVVDLFQKMIVPFNVAATETDTYRLDIFNRLTQRLHRNFRGNRFAFLVTSEMRKRDGRRTEKRPSKDDMKGDGRIASDADCVLILSNTRTVDSQKNEVLLDIDKGREGVIRGEHGLLFHHSLGRFETLNRDTQPDGADSPAQIVYDEE